MQAAGEEDVLEERLKDHLWCNDEDLLLMAMYIGKNGK